MIKIHISLILPVVLCGFETVSHHKGRTQRMQVERSAEANTLI